MREDYSSHTEADAAAYERARSADADDGRPGADEFERRWLASEPIDAWDAHEMDEARARIEAEQS